MQFYTDDFDSIIQMEMSRIGGNIRGECMRKRIACNVTLKLKRPGFRQYLLKFLDYDPQVKKCILISCVCVHTPILQVS